MMAYDDTPPPSDRVRSEWTVRAGNEYGSGIVAHHFTLWLLQLGAPPELIRAGIAVVEDELRHAEQCRALVRRLGRDEAPVLVRESLQLPRRPEEPLEHDVLRASINGFCIDETLAVTLFRLMRESASVPEIVELVEGFLRDEVHHRELGWVTLEWLLRGPQGEALRPMAERVATESLTQRGTTLCHPPGTRRLPTAAERAWGLMAHEQYVEVFTMGCRRDVLPRFRALGIAIDERLVEDVVHGHTTPA